MFTGIVNGTGEIIHKSGTDMVRLIIQFEEVSTSKLEIGASVSVDGVCLTVVEFEENKVSFDVIPETLRVTSLGAKSLGDKVNLERSLKLGDELGGHMLSGHIMGTGTISSVERNSDALSIKISSSENIMKYINPKGYVAIDGISLTIGEVDTDSFYIHLIPETIRLTTIGIREIGDLVNIEIDSMTQTIVSTVERIMEAKK